MNNEHIQRHFMSGAGNLFSVIDNRIYQLPLQELQKMAKQLCSLSNGETVDGLPMGVQLMTGILEEQELFDLSKLVEETLG